MNQADVTKLMSKLRFAVKPRRHFRNPKGPEGRLERMRETVAGLIKYERLELLYHQADEARGYAERVSFVDLNSVVSLSPYLRLISVDFRCNSIW